MTQPTSPMPELHVQTYLRTHGLSNLTEDLGIK